MDASLSILYHLLSFLLIQPYQITSTPYVYLPTTSYTMRKPICTMMIYLKQPVGPLQILICQHALRFSRYALNFSRKPTRKQKIYEQGLQSQSNIAQIDHHFSIFNETVTKVVDVGYVPGSWLEYAKLKLLKVHHVDPDVINTKCTLIGTDIICGSPIPGTITTQGNIYSQSVHDNVISLLKEAAFRRWNPSADGNSPDTDNSYLLKELQETHLEAELDGLAAAFNEFSLDDKEGMKKLLGPKLYQADVIMSDLATPFLQNAGFFNNTYARPYIRSSTNEALRQPTTNSQKASIDLAEAALLLCFDALVKNGTFVTRLAQVDFADPEIELFQSRLEKIFKQVERWSPREKIFSETSHVDDLYFISKFKRDYSIDKYAVFGVSTK